MNLALKYRPKTFEDMTEQHIVVDMLRSLCEQPTMDIRNFLLIGPAGCGKTTLSRIVANVINDGVGEPIEIDAASHSGVDAMREIVRQAQQYPVGVNYKVFIIDECFPADTWISTPSGKIQIKDIQEGDRVYNFTGQATVTRVLKNSVKTDNLVCVRAGSKQLITTKDHLFFTNHGWVPASKLLKGDMLYDYQTLQRMRAAVSSSISKRSEDSMQSRVSSGMGTSEVIESTYKCISENMSDMWKELLDAQEYRCNNMLKQVWEYLEEAESKYGSVVGATYKTLAYIYMSRMREAYGDSKQRSSKSMQFSVCDEVGVAEVSTNSSEMLRMVRQYIYSELQQSKSENVFGCMSASVDSQLSCRTPVSRIICTDATAQSNVQSGYGQKDDEHQISEWYATPTACISWWQRTLYECTDSIAECARNFVDIRVSCIDSSETVGESGSVSYELQARPSLSRTIAGNRGGWARPSYEIATVARCKKGYEVDTIRVDSVEVYQPGNNDELFRSSFKDTELSQPYVTMYDLEISGHPSYYANDVLVHNCHALSPAAWQSLLKVLEDNPAKTVFLLCTTNPEKIPATIISRVQVFRLSKISLSGITERLTHVLESEIAEGRSITYTKDAVAFIAKLANGGLRDSLTLLDKCLTYSSDLTSENVVSALNLPDYDAYFTLLNAYAKRDNTAVTQLVNDVYNSGVNFVRWFEGFHAFVMNVVKYIFLQDINLTTIPIYYEEKISKYGAPHCTLCLKLSDRLMTMLKDLKTTQYLQEVALTYLCQIPKGVK